jgi:stringent starvation protein B
VIPVKAVLAIFARENGEGMAFAYEHPEEGISGPELEGASANSSEKNNQSEEDPSNPPPRSPDGRPTLKVVK